MEIKNHFGTCVCEKHGEITEYFLYKAQGSAFDNKYFCSECVLELLTKLGLKPVLKKDNEQNKAEKA